jgi:hypothetical protein
MNAKQRLHYILNNREIIARYMAIHDEEKKTRQKPSVLNRLWNRTLDKCQKVVGSGKKW